MANTKKYVSLDKLGLYDEKIKKVVTDGDAAALQSAKDYADSLAVNYDAAGTAATEAGKVQAELDKEVTRAKAAEEANAAVAKKAQDEVDALELVVAGKAAQTDLDALAGKVGDVPADQTVMGIIQNIQENAYDDTELKAEINAELAKKADKTQVATDIAAAVKVEEEARIAAVSGVQSAVDALSGTHATDKKALEDAIALKADITALNAVSDVANAAVKQADYDVKVKALEDEDARIAGLVSAEATKAREEEGKLDARLVEVETFFKTAEGETIDQAMDTLVEIQKYITEDGAAADQMVKDIAANKKAIEDHVATDHNFAAADATLKAELEGKINAKADATAVGSLETRMNAAEDNISELAGLMILPGEVSNLQSAMGEIGSDYEYANVLEAIAGEIEKESLIREEAEAGLADRLDDVEAMLGDGDNSVAEMIATAKQEAIDAAASDAASKDVVVLSEAQEYADGLNTAMNTRVAAVEAASATHALASDVTALAGRVTTAEGEIDTLQGEMDAVEALAAAADAAAKANASAIALKASQADLEAVSGRVTTLETWHSNFVECSQEDINGLFA